MRWNCGRIKSTTEGDRFFVFCGFEPKTVVASPEFDKNTLMKIFDFEEDGFWVESLALYRNKNICWYASDVSEPLPADILESIDNILGVAQPKKLIKMPKRFGDFALACSFISENDYYVVCDEAQALMARDIGLSSMLLTLIDPTIVFDEIIDLRNSDTMTIINMVGGWGNIKSSETNEESVLYDGRFYDFSDKENVLYEETDNFSIYSKIKQYGTFITHDYQGAICAFAIGKKIIWLKGEAEKSIFPDYIEDSDRFVITSYDSFQKKGPRI